MKQHPEQAPQARTSESETAPRRATRCDSTRSGISRRALIRGVAGSAALAGIAATSPRITFAQTPSVPVPGNGTPPVGTPQAGPGGAQIIPSGVTGVPDVYLSQPQPFKSYDGVPGDGSKVSAFLLSYNPPPVAKDSNTYWQELEKRLGVTYDVVISPQPDYGEKSAALLASGDIPDLFYLNPEQNAPQQYQAMAQGAFIDLTPYVTGEALKQFKNLSTFPDYAWNNVKFNGKLYGVPNVQPKIGNLGFYRTDWAAKLGVTPTDPDTLKALLTGFTNSDPNGNGKPDTWGSGRFENGWKAWDNASMSQMHRVPFNWRLNSDGSLTYQIETDEYKQFLQYQTDLFAAGAFFPDAAGMSFSDAQNAFIAGRTGFHYEGVPSFFGKGSVTDRMSQANPGGTDTYILPNGTDGKPGVVYNGLGNFGYVGIPSSITDEKRILMLLRLLDWGASPFGSEEATFIGNGVEGVDSERGPDGNLTLTDKGRAEKGPLPGLISGIPVFYYANDPQTSIAIQNGGIASVKLGIDDPTQGLYSETNVNMSSQLTQLGTDTVTAIITGRQPMSSLDDAISQWKSRGGDQIRKDFEDALQKQG